MMNVKFGKKKNNEVIVNEDKFEKFVEIMKDAEKQFKSKLKMADYEASKAYYDELCKILATVTNPERKAMLNKYMELVAKEFHKKYPKGTLAGYSPDGLAGVMDDFYYTPSVRKEFTWKDNFVDVGCVVDIDTVDKLWKLCSDIIHNYKAMFIPEISECVGLLKKLTTAESISKGVKAKVAKYAKKFEEYFNDEEFVEFFKNNNDFRYFINEDNIDSDALLQYLRIYKQLYNDLGLDFTETKVWDMYINAEMLDMFVEDEDITRWRKDYFEYSDSDNYDDEYNWEGVGEEEYVEEEESED